MVKQQYQILIINGQGEKELLDVPLDRLILSAQQGAYYNLIEVASGNAPKHIYLKQDKYDLRISLGEQEDNVQILIEMHA